MADNYKDNYYILNYNKKLIDINEIKYSYSKKGNKKLLVQVPNTKRISISDLKQLPNDVLIRVEGPFTEDREKAYEGCSYRSGLLINEENFNQAIYTKDEMIKIIEKIEEIEVGINPYWDEVTKAYYVYDYLKKQIMYDPNYKKIENDSSKIRSLKGLIRDKTVCAGYAVIYKEILNRLGIKCAYIQGYVPHNNSRDGHAWNVIKLNDGRLIPIDVTWENTNLRRGNYNSIDYFGQNIDIFEKSHIPGKQEGFKGTFSSINKNDLMNIRKMITREQKYTQTTYELNRSDNSSFVISLIGVDKSNKFYRYYCMERNNNGTLSKPKLYVSEENFFEYINTIQFYQGNPNPTPEETEKYNRVKKRLHYFKNMLMSKINTEDSSKKDTMYIGKYEYKSSMVFDEAIKIFERYKSEGYYYPEIKIYDTLTNHEIVDTVLKDKILFIKQFAQAVGIQKKEDYRKLYSYKSIYNALLWYLYENGPLSNDIPYKEQKEKIIKYINSRQSIECSKIINYLVSPGINISIINNALCGIRIIKDDKTVNKMKNNYVIRTRSDGTSFMVISQGYKKDGIGRYPVNHYEIIELVNEHGIRVVKKNVVFTENDLMKQNNKMIDDVLLNRNRLDYKVVETGSYIGYIGSDGKKYDDSKWTNFFEPSSKPSAYKVIDVKELKVTDKQRSDIITNLLRNSIGGRSIIR